MKKLLSLLILAMYIGNGISVCAQVQPNIDFETGTTNVWQYFTGMCCPLDLSTPSPPVLDRHTITNGTATDIFGGFPVVSPYGGSYSLRLGNSMAGSEAERAIYRVHVPATTTNYSVIYHYAIVLEDGGHDSAEQPRFVVNVFDSATGNPISCAQFLYVASSALPGFIRYADSTNYTIYYRAWTMGSIDLSGYEGKTVNLVFSTGDCAQGGHFGYAYVDVTTGLFAIKSKCNAGGAALAGPQGYASYTWYDSATFTFIDTSQTLSVADTSGGVFALVLTPYPGFGCPDTLYTRVVPTAQLSMDPIDPELCRGEVATLVAHVAGANSTVNYSWQPPSAVDCSTCQSVHITQPADTPYLLIITAIDENDCRVVDSLWMHEEDCTNLWVPDAFTPNADGLNDIYRLLGTNLPNVSELRFGIFNRFGERVFFTQSVEDGWNGLYKGVPQEIGTYFYLLEYDLRNKHYMQSGDVTLVR